jgi:hypothetical protein
MEKFASPILTTFLAVDGSGQYRKYKRNGKIKLFDAEGGRRMQKNVYITHYLPKKRNAQAPTRRMTDNRYRYLIVFRQFIVPSVNNGNAI